MRKNPKNNTAFSLVTLGCEKNLVDSEKVVNSLISHGWTFRKNPQRAQVILVNTCGFIRAARQETVNTLKNLAYLKKVDRGLEIYVFGCMVAGWKEWLEQKFGGTFSGFFPSSEDLLMALQVAPVEDRSYRLTPRGYAYIKISEGCSRKCSFCIIPRLRGPQRSRPIAEIVREARMLAESGVKEIILVSQDAVNYGKDLSPPASLPALLRALSRVEGIQWVRLFYLYPSGVHDDLLEAFSYPRILPYFDLPIQSFSQRVLERMNRVGTVESYFHLVEKIRRSFPDAYIRTSVIVGFPGESEEDFSENLSALRTGLFSGLSAFSYSREHFSPSYHYSPQISEEEKQYRLSILMEAFEEVRAQVLRKRLNQKVSGIVEQVHNGTCVGRTWFQAPDVDGVTYWKNGNFSCRDLVELHLTDVVEYDFWAIASER
ncbi:MAG: 30S ribosomal protein S12 methylthiotransferase RimO [bacterium JZ-2024 1]